MVRLPDDYEVPTPKEVRVRLAELDMKPSEFADLVGMSHKHVGEWLHEKVGIRKVSQMRIADVFDELGKSDEDEEAS